MNPSLEELQTLLTNKTLDAATKIASRYGMTVRVMQRDGEQHFGIANYDIDRINVTVSNNIVTEVTSIG